MWKLLILILCTGSIIFTGCNNSKSGENEPLTPVIELQKAKIINSYFYEKEITSLTADATVDTIIAYETGVSKEITKTQRIKINVYKVINMYSGTIYKFAVDPIEDVDEYLADARLNIYFYVTSDKIYRMWSYYYDGDTVIQFYDDDELLVKTLDTEEKIINNSYLVLQQEELVDSPEEGEIGTHFRIEVNDNKILSRMWNIKTNGETGFYESFSWELGKGLTGYRSGFRAESETLYLNNIIEIDKK